MKNFKNGSLKEISNKVQKLYAITVTTTFRAGHQLKTASATEPYHTHDWIVEAAAGGEYLDGNDMLFDFNGLKKILDGAASPFNGRKLEDFDCFKGTNTSAEAVARYIYASIKTLLPERIEMLYVEVTETAGCKARYYERISV